MYTPDRELLRGLSLPVAECFGKPHYNAWYLTKGDNVKSYRFDHEAPCMVCGKPATNAHHQPPRSKGLLVLRGHVLRPALIALCGRGNTGCHGMVHNRQLSIGWEWLNDKYAEMWWSGELLGQMEPHSEELFNYGYWEIKEVGNDCVSNY